MAHAIYEQIDNAGEIPSSEKILAISLQPLENYAIRMTGKAGYSDKRIYDIILRGFRSFPISPENLYYKIDMSLSGNAPASCVIIGENGVGKTSVYSAFELMMLGEMPTAQLRGFSKHRQLDYAANIYSRQEDIDILLHAVSYKLRYCPKDNSDLRLRIPKSSFCSEWDVREIEQYTIGKYLNTQLGFENYKLLNDNLSEASSQFLKYKGIKDNLETSNVWLHQCYLGLKGSDKVKSFSKKIAGDYVKRCGLDLLKWNDQDQIKRSWVGLKNYISSINKEQKVIKECGVNKDLGYQKVKKNVGSVIKALNDYSKNMDETHATVIQDAIQNLKSSISFLEENRKELKEFIENTNDEAKKESYKVLKQSIEAITDYKILEKQYNEAGASPILSRNDGQEIADWQKEIENLRDTLRKDYLELIETEVYPIVKEIVKDLLDRYMDDPRLDVNVTFDKEDANEPIKIQLVHKNDEKSGDLNPVNPKLYFNTFRFKVYCVALKFAFFCCSKKIGKDNMPFIMDDIFDSSDFSNRRKIDEFIRRLYAGHDKIFGSDHPLQLIFFTQDDLIASRVYEGMQDSNKECKLMRLHPESAFTSREQEEAPKIEGCSALDLTDRLK